MNLRSEVRQKFRRPDFCSVLCFAIAFEKKFKRTDLPEDLKTEPDSAWLGASPDS